jgi:hypothetical protein
LRKTAKGKTESLRLEKRGIVERLDHGVDHVGGGMVFALFQEFPHLAQIGAFSEGSRSISVRAMQKAMASVPIRVCSTVGLLMAGSFSISSSGVGAAVVEFWAD